MDSESKNKFKELVEKHPALKMLWHELSVCALSLQGLQYSYTLKIRKGGQLLDHERNGYKKAYDKFDVSKAQFEKECDEGSIVYPQLTPGIVSGFLTMIGS